MRLLLSVLLTTALPALAEGLSDARINIPSTGFVYEAGSHSVRPVAGTPGAALLGDPVDVGFGIACAAVSAEQRYMLALAVEGQLRLVRFDGAPARIIAGALPSFTHVALSPSGTAAVLYDEASSRVQTISGLPDNPTIRAEFSTARAGAAVGVPAVSDDASAVLFAAESLWVLELEAGESAIPVQAAAASFRSGGRDAVVISDDGDLYAFKAQGLLAIGRVSAAGNPVAVRLSRTGDRAYVAFSKGTIVLVDTKTGATSATSCDCSVTALDPMQAQTLFRLNDPSGAPLMLLDVSGALPRIWFVPAAIQETER